MAVFKCKMCGGSLNVTEKSRIATCEYCGTSQTVPQNNDEKLTELFNHANRLRIDCEFDKAAIIYESIAAKFPDEAEAFWGLCLCEYGIEYVDDSKSNKKIPTCHRTSVSSILDDANYLKTIDLAEYTSMKLYELEAKEIDRIQKNILKIVSNEQAYDVFICYKETDDETGNRTEDSSIAQDIYTELTAQGYRVFYARTTLRSVAGQDYEPYIYSALSTAKVMIAIGTKPAYWNAVWVKNEWSRFLDMMRLDPGKRLIPCFKHMDAYDLPKEFGQMQAINVSDVTFFHTLLTILQSSAEKRQLVRPNAVAEPQKKKAVAIVAAAVAAVAVLGILALKQIKNGPEETTTKETVQEIETTTKETVQEIEMSPEYKAAKELLETGQYAEAVWAFDALGDYLDAEEQKQVAEKSWRNSLSSFAVDSAMSSGTAAVSSSYYIDVDGTVKNFSHDEGDDHFSVIKQEKSRISSITPGDVIYALTENGDVINAEENNDISDPLQWHNIVQITPQFHKTNLALRADGRVIAGLDTTEIQSMLHEVMHWEDIVKLDYYVCRYGAGGVMECIIVGIDKQGGVHAAKYIPSSNLFGEKEMPGWYKLLELTDIVDVDVQISNDVEFVALTAYGSVISYMNGEFSEVDAPDIINVELILYGETTYCALSTTGELRMKNGELIMPDVAYINDGYFVTKNGSIFRLEGIGEESVAEAVQATEGTTKVLDEWLVKSRVIVEDVVYENKIQTKYLTLELPNFWNGYWGLEEESDFSFTVYQKDSTEGKWQGDLVSVTLCEQSTVGPGVKLGDILIEGTQYGIFVQYYTGDANAPSVLYTKMAESLDAVLLSMKANGNYKMTVSDTMKNMERAGVYSSDAAKLTIESAGDQYVIAFDIWRLTGLGGTGTHDGDGIRFVAEDAAGGDMTLRITFKGNTATVVVENSTWDYLPNGDKFTLEKEDSYH